MPAAFLLDAPPLPDGEETVTCEHPVAKLGSFKDRRYGAWTWTAKDFNEWNRVFQSHQGGEILFDYDHESERPGGSTKAAGWINGLRLEGDKVLASIEWTPEGADAVRKKYWRYVSPVIGPVKDEQDRKVGVGFASVTLTNRPFLRDKMPAISLSVDFEDGSFAEEEALSDTPTVPDLTKIAETLKLSADATEDQVLEAIGKLAETPAPETDTKTLTEQAAAEGKVLLSADKLAELTEAANEGKAAAQSLSDQRFELAYTKALENGCVEADANAEEGKDGENKLMWRGLYDADSDRAIKALSGLKPIVSLTGPRGKSGGDPLTDNATFEGENADPDSARLLKQAEKLVADEKITLNQAIDRVMAEAV